MKIVRPRFTSFRSALAVSALALSAVMATGGVSSSWAAAVDDLLDEARRYRAEGRVSESIIQLKNALQEQPSNAEANALLGGLYMDLGDTARAEVQLTRARDLGAPADDWLKPLLLSWLSLGRTQEVLATVADLPESMPARLRADALALAGRAHLARGDADRARTTFEEAAALAPDSALAHVGIGRMALRDGDLAAAVAAAQAALKADPEESDAVYLAGDVALREKRMDDALALYRGLRDRYPLNPFVRIPLAQALVQADELDAADTEISFVLERVQGLPMAHYLKGLVSYRKGDLAGADTQLTEGLAMQPGNAELQMLAGLTKYGLGQDEQAVRLLESFANRPETPTEVRLALGSSLLRLGRAEDSYGVLSQVSEAVADNAPAVALLGQAAQQAGDLEEASVLLERALALAPDDSRVIGQLAVVFGELGRQQDAMDLLARAVEKNPDDSRTRSLYFAMLLRADKATEALAVAQAVQQARPDDAAGYTMEGLAQVALRDQDAAEAAFREALKRNPGASDAAGNLASLLIMKGRDDEARDLMVDAHAQSPGDYDILMRLARMATDRGAMDDARTWLDLAVKADPTAVEPRVRSAALMLEERRYEPALALMLPLMNQHPRDPRVLRAVAIARSGTGDVPNAVAALQTLVEVEPNEANYRLLQSAAQRAGDRVLMQRSLERLVQLAPADPLPKVALAELYMQDRRPFDAEPLVAAAAELAPNDPKVIEQQARLRLESDRAGGTEFLRSRLTGMETPPRNLVILLAHAEFDGDREAGITRVAQWLEANPDDQDARFLLSNWQIGQENWAGAADNLRRVTEAQPANWIARNNYAWVLLRKGDAETALEQAEVARTHGGDRPEILDTEGQIRLALGQPAEAELLFRRAAGQSAKPGFRLNLAEALVVQNKSKEAREVLNDLIATDDFAGKNQARDLLARLGD
ncbi:XrtA/PEP-CTERM system TPR-repeat protein PrsT [Caenispirillum bisanense]|uniref:XrtA/PEP-CTERM system TPR-repeat protein PrsT n=1 Tax=Caenispirillum bisanense TaxID=414052 RepID=UPI000BE491DA|nr:XrtA/PEP-CTERM system TPR-repeat protein PrsT [Caenispirillum bisanense]